MRDIVLVREVGLSGADDPIVLDWEARNGRIVLTHDVSTMTKFAYERTEVGKPMPGIFEVNRYMQIGTAIAELLLLAEGSFDNEWERQVHYLS